MRGEEAVLGGTEAEEAGRFGARVTPERFVGGRYAATPVGQVEVLGHRSTKCTGGAARRLRRPHRSAREWPYSRPLSLRNCLATSGISWWFRLIAAPGLPRASVVSLAIAFSVAAKSAPAASASALLATGTRLWAG